MSVLTVVRVAIHDVIIRIVFFLDYAMGAEEKNQFQGLELLE